MRFRMIFVVPLLLVGRIATAQSWTPPAENQRCPSKWGAGDERGSGNLMKPEQVLKATKLIRNGEVIELGQVLDPGTMPFFPGRQLSILTKRTNVLDVRKVIPSHSLSGALVHSAIACVNRRLVSRENATTLP